MEAEARQIEAHKQLDKHNFDQIYVVTDHESVLFPEEPTMGSLPTDDDTIEVKYRRIAGDTVSDITEGVLIEAQSPGAN